MSYAATTMPSVRESGAARWIFATREKPEPFEPIIGTAFIAGQECTIQALLEWNGTQWWIRDERYAYDREVLRWMYLPEPPKTGPG